MRTTHANRRQHATGSYWRSVAVLGVLGIGLYLIVPQVAGLGNSWNAITGADLVWLLVAGGSLLLTYLLAALLYVLLAQKPLAYGRTVLVQLAGMFASRILPAGLGSLSLNYVYLRRQGYRPAQASAVVAANNALGFIGNMLLVLGCAATAKIAFPVYHTAMWVGWLVIGLLLLGIVLWSVWGGKYWSKARHGLGQVAGILLAYRRRPWRLLAALGSSMVLTALYALALYACVRAVGLQLAFPLVIIVMTAGVAGATVTPTPGGLGGAEAALVGGLVLYGMPAPTAIAAALLYRLFTYWLGLILGGIALVVSERRGYLLKIS